MFLSSSQLKTSPAPKMQASHSAFPEDIVLSEEWIKILFSLSKIWEKQVSRQIHTCSLAEAKMPQLKSTKWSTTSLETSMEESGSILRPILALDVPGKTTMQPVIVHSLSNWSRLSKREENLSEFMLLDTCGVVSSTVTQPVLRLHSKLLCGIPTTIAILLLLIL